MGKWHLGDEIFRQHGFDEWVSMEYYDGYYSKGRDRTKKPDYHHFLVKQGYKPDSGGKSFSRGFAARRPIEHCKPKFLETRACEFMRRNRDRPFMLYVNFLEPHMPFFGPLDKEHDPDKIDLPANFRDPLEDNEPLRYRVIREYCRTKYGKGEQDIRKLIARYWGLVTQVDRSVGVMLDTLAKLGLADNTIVVYTSDHGDMMGSHHMVEKCVMYEEAVRVPWLMRIPGPALRPGKIRQPVSHIDMVPTLLELMGRKPDKTLPGQSLIPLMIGRRVEQDHVFIEWTPGQGAIRKIKGAAALATAKEIAHVAKEHTRTVVSPDGWKLCLSDRDKCQLFNLNDDPGETKNLFDSPKHRDVIRRLTEKIRQWQRASGDEVKV
jgi:arylsulfatase A-like enzyme